jgi:hypothetical protein
MAKRRKRSLAIDLDGVLAHLEGQQLVRQLSGEEPAYTFKHVLTQETAYQSLLVKRRREIHRQIAEHYEETCGDDLTDYADLLAYHYAEAGDDPKTLYYATLAGDIAKRRYANTEAIVHYDRALAVGRRSEISGELLLHLYGERGRALELGHRYAEALANYEEMEALARLRGDRALELAAMTGRTTIYANPTAEVNLAQAEALGAQALALAQELGDRQVEAKIRWNLMSASYFMMRVKEAVAYGEKSAAIARELDLREQLAYTLNDIYRPYLVAGQFDRARAALYEARALWQSLDNLPMLADNHASATIIDYLSGDYAQVIAEAEAADRLSQSIGNAWGRSYSRLFLGATYLEIGQPGKAIEVMEECAQFGEQAGFVVAAVFARVDLAYVYAVLGAVERGLELIQSALARPEAGFVFAKPLIQSTLAQLYLFQGNDAAAEAALQEVNSDTAQAYSFWFSNNPLPIVAGELALARRNYAQVIAAMDEYITFMRQVGLHTSLAHALYLKSKARLALRRADEARAALLEARAEAEALGARRILWEILFALSEMEAQRDNADEAVALRRQAQEIVEYIADHVGAPELRASFLNLPKVRAVLSADQATDQSDEGGEAT